MVRISTLYLIIIISVFSDFFASRTAISKSILQHDADGVKIRATVTVSKNGFGNFSRINDAVAMAPNNSNGDEGFFHIKIMEGEYEEYIKIDQNKRYLMMSGAGINRTIITGNHSYEDGWGIDVSATFRGRLWDLQRIRLILPEYEDLILSIKHSTTGAPDKLMWLGTKSGEYATKSGYYAAVEDEDHQDNEFAGPDFNWKKCVWNVDTAPKLKLFAWKILKGALPVGERLVDRHIDIDPKCKRCGCIESITHLFFHCPFARKVWRLAPLVADVECSGMVDLIASWSSLISLHCLPPTGISSGSLTLWILWMLWKSRNRLVFEGFSVSPEDTLLAAIRAAREWSENQKRDDPPRKRGKKPELTCPMDATVVRTDAAWNSNLLVAGLGWVQLLREGNQSFKDRAAHVGSALMAEALALREAVATCKRMELKKVKFESDSAQLVSIINAGARVAELHGVVADILTLSLSFEFVAFVWIPRERNTIADLLAKNAINASGLLLVEGAFNGPN